MILVRYGELYLKSPPVQRKFQNTLAWNIREMCGREGIRADVRNGRGRIFVDGPAESVLKRTFGVVSFSPSKSCASDMASIVTMVSKIKLSTSFALKITRNWKQFPKTSMELAKELGKIIQDSTGASVDLSSPGTTVELEIRKDKTYLFTKRIQGPGGLPLGTGGKCLSLISSASSFRSTYLMMKRGITPICAYTDKKYLPIIKKLERYSSAPLKKLKTKDLNSAEKIAAKLSLPAIIIPDKTPKKSTLLLLQPLTGQ